MRAHLRDEPKEPIPHWWQCSGSIPAKPAQAVGLWIITKKPWGLVAGQQVRRRASAGLISLYLNRAFTMGVHRYPHR